MRERMRWSMREIKVIEHINTGSANFQYIFRICSFEQFTSCLGVGFEMCRACEMLLSYILFLNI